MNILLPVSNGLALRRLASFAAHAPPPARRPAATTIRALRAALRMSQAQLAKKAGLPQSHMARIESGKVDPQLGTLRKLFAALSCEMLVVPRLDKSPREILRARAREKARSNVLRVAGTMALEGQAPDERTFAALVKSEEARLLARPSSELWSD